MSKSRWARIRLKKKQSYVEFFFNLFPFFRLANMAAPLQLQLLLALFVPAIAREYILYLFWNIHLVERCN